jgi:hypothetical protein
MKFKLFLCLMVLIFGFSANFAQTELTIRKKSSMKIPGMPAMPQMPAGMPNPMDSLENRKSTVYIKGPRMRTDMNIKSTDGKAPMLLTTIIQCDKQRRFQFNNKKKKYYVESTSAPTSANVKNANKGGYITVTGSVNDTGERAKLFGYDARHLKETITFTPSKNACMKQSMQIEIEGWYADVPEFSCPMKRNMSEFQMENNCFDDVDLQVTGTITGIPLREIKKITTNGMSIIMEEETVEILKLPLAEALFEPPANYQAANTLKEVADDSPDDSPTTPTNTTIPQPTNSSSTLSPTFALPKAGIENPAPTEKQPGMIRIGIAKPKVTVPDSKKDPDAAADLAFATTNLLIESLKSESVEAIQLETDFPENEAQERGCNYIFYTNITQKRGGGMFGKMVMMGAVTTASVLVPGIGGMIAGTVASQVMGQTMTKNAKAKDEFTFEYKVAGMDKNIISQAATKVKTEKDGEDPLTPQIQQASKTVLSIIGKN